MSVVNTENYSQGPLPTVFEKPVLFPHPQTIQDAQYKTKRSGGGMTAFLIFLAMLVPCGLLGYVMYTQDTTIKTMQAEAENVERERLAGLNEQIRTLEAETTELSRALVEIEPVFGRLLNERQSKLREIRYDLAEMKGVAKAERLASENQARDAAIADGTYNEENPPLVPETDKEKEIAAYETAIVAFSALPDEWTQDAQSKLQAHVDTVEDHRQYVRDWRPAARPDPGPVVPSRGRIVTNDQGGGPG